MVLRIAEKVQANKYWSAALDSQKAKDGKPAGTARRSDNWSSLAEKLRALVRMRGSWGELHNIYETRSVSLFEENPLPPWTRDPESNFSMIWDMTSAVMLLYVTVTVPLRVCFNVEIELWCGPRCRRSAHPVASLTCMVVRRQVV